MRTAVTTTSISAYRGHRANSYAGQHGIVLAVMRPGHVYSRRQIAQLSKLETSTVSARVNELLVSGQLEICGLIRCVITGVTVQAVKLVAVQRELV